MTRQENERLQVAIDGPAGAGKSSLAKALALRKPAVIDCTLDIDEMVRPMVAAGAEITDFLLSEGGD